MNGRTTGANSVATRTGRLANRLAPGVATLALVGLCATPLAGGAQEQPQIADGATGSEPPTTQHHHYKLIDIGTFGGPQSYFNDLNLTDVFNYGTAFYAFAQILNVQGTLVGFADTRTPDPYSANPEFCYVLDCFITHAYAWRNGARSDLGTLPGGASSAAFWINSHGWIAPQFHSSHQRNIRRDREVNDEPGNIDQGTEVQCKLSQGRRSSAALGEQTQGDLVIWAAREFSVLEGSEECNCSSRHEQRIKWSRADEFPGRAWIDAICHPQSRPIAEDCRNTNIAGSRWYSNRSQT